MNFHILTLFPEMVENGLNTSITGRAVSNGYISINAINIRDYTTNKHNKVDDYPYGGGAGMLMQAQPVFDAYQAVADKMGKKPRTIYVTPQGKVFHQEMAKELAKEEDLVFLCGHYEGIDERALEEMVTDYVSIGDYVLTGGELPTMVMVDAISRMVPGVLSNEVSGETESLEGNLLEHPQYSRPEVWKGKGVPKVLLSGNHERVEEWRREQSILRTKMRRPDLFAAADLTPKEENRWRDDSCHIRLSTPEDLPALDEIFESARQYMRQHKNETQWGNGYPSHELLLSDMDKQASYVVEKDGVVAGTFYFAIEEDPCYRVIENGRWINEDVYGVIHRVAVGSDFHKIGLASKAICYAKEACLRQGVHNIRMDTHADNKPMQRTMRRNGFEECGIVTMDDNTKRKAYMLEI